MIDTHIDLLTIAYCCYLKDDYTSLIELRNIMESGNIVGAIANLYFMSIEEMNEELGTNYYTGDIIQMFEISKRVLTDYIPNIKFKFSIEGCDYLDLKDLEPLKRLGLDSIILCWNNPNKYGSGIRGNVGLTSLGKEFIHEAMRLNLGIDISHANKKTSIDILNILKSNNYPLVYASHSNIKSIFNNLRNLDDEQLELMKAVNAKLGLVAINYFCTNEDEFIEHIKYASDILGINNIMIATDNLDYIDQDVSDIKLYELNLISKRLHYKLQKYFNLEEIENILYKNALTLFSEMEENL